MVPFTFPVDGGSRKDKPLLGTDPYEFHTPDEYEARNLSFNEKCPICQQVRRS